MLLPLPPAMICVCISTYMRPVSYGKLPPHFAINLRYNCFVVNDVDIISPLVVKNPTISIEHSYSGLKFIHKFNQHLIISALDDDTKYPREFCSPLRDVSSAKYSLVCTVYNKTERVTHLWRTLYRRYLPPPTTHFHSFIAYHKSTLTLQHHV